MYALSIRQPWAWFIFHGHPLKDIENRDWQDDYAKAQFSRVPPGSNILIHAAAGCTEQEFLDACDFALTKAGCTTLPRFETLERGGIVGMVKFSAALRGSRSKWFVGPIGLKLEDPYPLPFQPCKGALGFFQVNSNFPQTPKQQTSVSV